MGHVGSEVESSTRYPNYSFDRQERNQACVQVKSPLLIAV